MRTRYTAVFVSFSRRKHPSHRYRPCLNAHLVLPYCITPTLPYPTLRYATLPPQLYFPRGTCKRAVGVNLSRSHAINSCNNSTPASHMTRPAPILPKKKGTTRSAGESSYGRKGVSVGVSPLPHPGLGLPGRPSEGGELRARAVHARARPSRKGCGQRVLRAS